MSNAPKGLPGEEFVWIAFYHECTEEGGPSIIGVYYKEEDAEFNVKEHKDQVRKEYEEMVERNDDKKVDWWMKYHAWYVKKYVIQ